MSFFDLSIPYIEKSGAPSIDARSRRDCRLRTVARAMELGYTAVAYDRSFRGVLSDADRCQIAPFPPQSFLESVAGCSPAAFSASVALHRDLLGVPRASPFQQYTRITVSVDSVAAASALNSGNRLLRSYDLVATRPLNQLAFDQACNASEVDIILLDFSQKLPFRLKLAMVQAAIKRGVHFEISYSHIIAGGHARRQILSEAKRLAEWTPGKNLIISSSAASLNEIRGPCDVANLSTVLLGLTIERSKAAISGNCRSLVANALRKKDCYFKEAIRIERILLPEEKKDSQADWFIESNDWDPISSGENDLPSPDDMFKLFSAASKHSKSQNAVDFTSSINGMAPNSSIFSTTYKLELDSDDVERHNNVDPVSAENVAAMAAKSETKPCSIENGVAINALANPNPSWAAISISDDLTLKASDQMIDAFIMSDEDVEITDQVDAVSVFAQTASNVNNSLDCSFSDTVSALEEHYLEKMEIQEKILSSGNVQLNGYPDKMGGKEQLAVLFETSISDDDARVKIKQEKQQFSASTIVILPDSSAKLEAQLQKNVCSRRNNSKGFGAKTKGKKKRFAAAEIEEADVFSEEISTSKKNEPSFSLEIHSLLNEMEGQNIERPAEAGGLPDRHVHKSGKQKLRRRSHHRGYLLTARSLCKPLVFKKAGRLRRMRKFL